MAITQDDFKKVWASTSSVPEYTFSDTDYKNGWEFVGNLPPTRAMWDELQRKNDEKMQFLQENGSMCFDSVADMKSSNLDAGQTAFTKGYYSINDGGSAVYTIRAKTQEDVDDGGSIIFLDNGNVAEKLGEEINPDQFPGVNDAVKLQNAIDYAITKKSATITIKRKYDITGSTLYINKGYGRTSLRQHLIFMGTGTGEIYKGDSGYMFSGNHSPEGANFTAGDVCFMNLTFRGADDIPSVADMTSLCSVFDVSKILRINSINNSYSAVNKVFDGTLSASQSTTTQQVYTFGDLCTDSYCYIYMGTTYALYVHCATVERCVYGVTNHINDSGFMYMTSIHFRDCVIEGCSSGGIKIVGGSTPSAYALTNFTVDGCYFEANGSENLVIHVTFARNIKITNNKFTMNANSTDLWVTSDDWILDGNLNFTETATGTYMFNISNTPSSNIKIVTRNNAINVQQLTNKPEVIITGDKIDKATMSLSPIGQGSVFFDRCGRLVMVKFGNITNLPAGRNTLDNTIPIEFRPIEGVVYTLNASTLNILVFLNTDGTIIVHNRGSAISSSTPVYDTFWYFV